jgi:hypothetical protein
MARMNNHGKKLALGAVSLFAFLALTGGATYFLLHKSNAFANLPAFPLDTYMEGAKLWSHEDYKLEGRVDNVIMRSQAGDKLLVVVQPEKSELRVPVVLDKSGGKIPVQREQHLVLKVELGPAAQILSKYYETR